MMQLRFLKRARSNLNVWPPSDCGHYGLRDGPQLQQRGVLTAVSQIGHHLSVTIKFDGRQHIMLLSKWTEPPTLDEVHSALRTVLGKRVWEVGQVDIGEVRRRDDGGY
jgi:hypothetical protein